ncbi:hypothetical protein P4O66_014927 [Electrophorus voltai]|uniref:Uncharacterized protein n=1 Tax=Electrophorus voltai TaxID=2609070 RepID=A0AAD9DNY8_9TELE|nr:hypothetical protein P4O66_014927 [Electrophorus voltai]
MARRLQTLKGDVAGQPSCWPGEETVVDVTVRGHVERSSDSERSRSVAGYILSPRFSNSYNVATAGDKERAVTHPGYKTRLPRRLFSRQPYDPTAFTTQTSLNTEHTHCPGIKVKCTTESTVVAQLKARLFPEHNGLAPTDMRLDSASVKVKTRSLGHTTVAAMDLVGGKSLVPSLRPVKLECDSIERALKSDKLMGGAKHSRGK